MATSMLLKFLTLKWDISRTIWRIEVSDGSIFCIFHALLFELIFFFDWSFPLTAQAFKMVITTVCVQIDNYIVSVIHESLSICVRH